MTASLAAPAVATCPTTWTLPRLPDDDVTAVRQIAAAYQQLAVELRGAAQAAQLALNELPGAWQGQGASAAAHPTQVLVSDVDLVCRGLLEAAGALAACAVALQHAHDQHGWSLGKILKVASVVAASAAAVTVTAGAAAPEAIAADGALVGGEVAAAETAVAAASAARTGATVALSSSTRLLSAVRGLAAFIRPQLPWATGFTGMDATWQVEQTGSLDLRELAVSFGMNMMLPKALAKTRSSVRAMPLLIGRPRAAAVVSHVAAGGVVAAFDAGRQELMTGRVDRGHVLRAGITGTGLSAVGTATQRVAPLKWRPAVTPGIAAKVKSYQDIEAILRDGAVLREHEGQFLGHTIDRHVGKPVDYLEGRAEIAKRGPFSTYRDLPTAERAVTSVLRGNEASVRSWMATSKPGQSGEFKLLLDDDLGSVLQDDGSLVVGRTAVVRVLHRENGFFVLTSFLES